MKAMVLKGVSGFAENPAPLVSAEVPEPTPGEGEILIAVSPAASAIRSSTRSKGRTPPPAFPVILGHQVVGKVAALGQGAGRFRSGRPGGGGLDPLGLRGLRRLPHRKREPLLAVPRHGSRRQRRLCGVHDRPGGLRLPHPGGLLRCGGGAAPVRGGDRLPVAPSRRIFRTGRTSASPVSAPRPTSSSRWSATAFLSKSLRLRPERAGTRLRPRAGRRLGRGDGGGAAGEAPRHHRHDARLETGRGGAETPAPGGRLVINAIRKEERDKAELLRLDYPAHLWLEKEIKSVANVARRDISEFLALAAEIPLRPEVEEYPLADANRALAELKAGKIRGAKVLRMA